MSNINDRMKRDMEEAEGRRKEVARLAERRPVVKSRSIYVDPRQPTKTAPEE
jgi:hypothetical protein